MSNLDRWIDDETFHADVQFIESCLQQRSIGTIELPLLDLGQGAPVVFVPIMEQLEFVYARQIRTLSKTRRVLLYRRQEMRTRPFGPNDRAEELRQVLDGLGLDEVDLVGHGGAAMVLFEFALRYPQRCHSLTIVAQGADYRIHPYPFVRFLHEVLYRFPIEHVLPPNFLRDSVINYIIAHNLDNKTIPVLPRHLIEEQFNKINQWPDVYKCSVLPIIHNFDIHKRVSELTMPVLLINRTDDALAPENSTRWLAEHLPHCIGYHVVSGREHFFMYSRAETVTPLIETFLSLQDAHRKVFRHI